jgi:hypothetical protein
MPKISKVNAGVSGRRNFHFKDSDISAQRARLLKLQTLDERRTQLLSEVSTISGLMRVLKAEVAEDLAAFRRGGHFHLGFGHLD